MELADAYLMEVEGWLELWGDDRIVEDEEGRLLPRRTRWNGCERVPGLMCPGLGQTPVDPSQVSGLTAEEEVHLVCACRMSEGVGLEV